MHDFHWTAILWLKQNVSDAMLKEKSFSTSELLKCQTETLKRPLVRNTDERSTYLISCLAITPEHHFRLSVVLRAAERASSFG